jgi:trimeric autotransporter adhesin
MSATTIKRPATGPHWAWSRARARGECGTGFFLFLPPCDPILSPTVEPPKNQQQQASAPLATALSVAEQEDDMLASDLARIRAATALSPAAVRIHAAVASARARLAADADERQRAAASVMPPLTAWEQQQQQQQQQQEQPHPASNSTNETAADGREALLRAIAAELAASSSSSAQPQQGNNSVRLRRALGARQPRSYLRQLRHAFLVVRCEGGGEDDEEEEVLVDPSFREHFVLMPASGGASARAAGPAPATNHLPSARRPLPSPLPLGSTPAYDALVRALPRDWVGTPRALAEVLDVMGRAVRAAFRASGVPLPPWREPAALASRWMPERFEETSGLGGGGASLGDDAAPPACGHLAAAPPPSSSPCGGQQNSSSTHKKRGAPLPAPAAALRHAPSGEAAAAAAATALPPPPAAPAPRPHRHHHHCLLTRCGSAPAAAACVPAKIIVGFEAAGNGNGGGGLSACGGSGSPCARSACEACGGALDSGRRSGSLDYSGSSGCWPSPEASQPLLLPPLPPPTHGLTTPPRSPDRPVSAGGAGAGAAGQGAAEAADAASSPSPSPPAPAEAAAAAAAAATAASAAAAAAAAAAATAAAAGTRPPPRTPSWVARHMHGADVQDATAGAVVGQDPQQQQQPARRALVLPARASIGGGAGAPDAAGGSSSAASSPPASPPPTAPARPVRPLDPLDALLPRVRTVRLG